MIIVLILISVIGGIISLWNDESDFAAIFGFGLLLKTAVACILLGLIINGRVIDQKIELVETKNQEIESKVETSVKAYMEFENKTYSDLKVDSYIQLVNLYPELKSDELIRSEIELYQDNVKEITNLKKGKINISNYKFWLYFGK